MIILIIWTICSALNLLRFAIRMTDSKLKEEFKEKSAELYEMIGEKAAHAVIIASMIVFAPWGTISWIVKDFKKLIGK